MVGILHLNLGWRNLNRRHYHPNVQLSKPKIIDTLNYEVALFADRYHHLEPKAAKNGSHLLYLQTNLADLAKWMGRPKLLLQLLHGKHKDDSRRFEQIQAQYGDRLEAEAIRERKNDLGIIQPDETEKLLVGLDRAKARLVQHSEKWGRGTLDLYRLPHPLLGKLTARETLYVTILEVQFRSRLLE